jgi:hypothetical protein
MEAAQRVGVCFLQYVEVNGGTRTHDRIGMIAPRGGPFL